MMQVPLLSYPQFSQFLQLQQEQHQLQQHYSRGFLRAGGGMLARSGGGGGTPCSDASTASPTPSPSPPLSVTCESPPNRGQQTKSGKSFTIDAILGIGPAATEDGAVGRDGSGASAAVCRVPSPATAAGGVFHPRRLPGLRDGYAGLDGAGKMDVTRLSREVLAFQLPTDLSSSSASSVAAAAVAAAAAAGRREPMHPSASFPRLSTDKAVTSESSKKCSGKSKRVRTIFTPEQLERLEAEFERQQYMVGPERLYLAHTLQLTEAQVKVWFQNRRIKWRKQHLEMQQQRLAAMKQQQQQHRTDGGGVGGEEDDEDDDETDEEDSVGGGFRLDVTESTAGSAYYGRATVVDGSGLDHVGKREDGGALPQQQTTSTTTTTTAAPSSSSSLTSSRFDSSESYEKSCSPV